MRALRACNSRQSREAGPVVRVEIINTGSELMLGRVLNTHQQWLCRRLADLGYVVDRQTASSDDPEAIRQLVTEALSRADLVLVTGGLGPTSDDRTRDVIAALAGRNLHEDPDVLANIERFFSARKRAMPERVKVQALVPDGALVLANAHGTAPGLVLEFDPLTAGGPRRLLVMLPGPPRELYPMFTQQVVPLLGERLPMADEFICVTLRTTGIGESFLEERIDRPLQPLIEAGLALGYCARSGEVDIRLAARGPRARALVAEGESVVRGLAGDLIFGSGDELLEGVLIRMLTERGKTLAVAESCTGGLISHRLTNVPGASLVFLAGLVTYANDAKQTFLGVRPTTLSEHGAVSEPTAKEMAEGARARIGSDYAIAVTGIAGPGGGSDVRPVGTVFIGLASRERAVVRRFLHPYDRETFKNVTSQQALELLRRELLGGSGLGPG